MSLEVYGFDAETIRRIAAAVRAVEGEARGDSGDKFWRQPQTGAGFRDGFWSKVTASSVITSGHRQYTYTVVEQQRTASGSLSPWQTKSGGRTVTAHNSIEAFNTTGAVVLGNSIDHGAAGYPSTDWHQPVTGNPVVWVTGEYATDGSYVYTFQYVNSEQGAC